MEFSDDLVQFYPNRISITSPRARDWQLALERKAGLHPSMVNLAKKKSSVNLSASSRRNIRDSIFSMYQLSKPRTVKTPAGKFIYNFRQSFITLTLPSEQRHSDVELKKALNHFLTNVRRAFKIENYVWKAELQKNDNIHFHISLDKYVHFQAIRYYWLLAIKPLGYIDKYAQKFSKMSLREYAEYRGLSIQEARNAYAQGVRSRWQSPNCVDVSAVTTASSVSNYLSKYFAKNETEMVPSPHALSQGKNSPAEKMNISIATLIRYRRFGKVWARSTSLSRLKYRNKFHYKEVRKFIAQLLEMGAVTKVAYDYSTVYYINFKKLIGVHLRWFINLLRGNAERYLYPFPT